MLVRSSPALRAAIRTAAEAEGMPINEWIVRCLATAVGFQRREITKVVGHVWEAPPGDISAVLASLVKKGLLEVVVDERTLELGFKPTKVALKLFGGTL